MYPTVVVDFPPLIICPVTGTLNAHQEATIKNQLDRQRQNGGVLVFAFPINVWQCVDGKWEALPTKVEAANDE